MPPPTPAIAPLPVTLLTGLDAGVTSLLATGLLLREPGVATVRVDTATMVSGRVHCVLDHADGRHERRRVDLVGGCVACTWRAAVVAALAVLAADTGDARADAVTVDLLPGLRADVGLAALCADLPAAVARVDTVVAVLAAGSWLTDLAGDAEVGERGIGFGAGDDQPLAMLVGAQLDVAERLVVTSSDGRAHPLAVDEAVALRALAPTARRIVPPTVLDVPAAQVLRTGSHDPRCLHPLADRGLLDWTVPVRTGGGVDLVRWALPDRPLSGERLHEAADSLAAGVVRSSGRLWLAPGAHTAARWDSCGDALSLSPSVPWAGSSARPGSRMAFLGRGLDARHITRTLDACALD